MNKGYLGLAITCVVTASVITYVHWDQKKEIRRMREGVYRDAERERSRRAALSKTSSSIDNT